MMSGHAKSLSAPLITMHIQGHTALRRLLFRQSETLVWWVIVMQGCMLTAAGCFFKLFHTSMHELNTVSGNLYSVIDIGIKLAWLAVHYVPPPLSLFVCLKVCVCVCVCGEKHQVTGRGREYVL